MALKFIRALTFSTGGTAGFARASYLLKFMYEFWGHCIYGGASLTTPGAGAFATTTPFGGSLPENFKGVATTIAVASNGAILPQTTINVASTTNFPTSGTIFVFTSLGTQTVTYTGIGATTFTGCSGGLGTMSTGNNVTSSSLMTIGADGYTNATTIFRMDGYTDFFATSAPFTSNMVGKQLVMWKAGSNSSEDSIYNIIAFKTSNNIVINVNNGGTPSIEADGYRPTVTTRSSINYRVVDINTAGTTAGIADGNFIVFQLDPTGVNAGQNNSQIQFLLAGGNVSFNARMSPNGSWTGSAFGVDGSGVISPNAGVGGFTTFFNGTTSSGQQGINLIGDKSFLICNIRDGAATSGATFHFEIPERLYTLAQDQNPLIMSLNGFHNTGNVQFHSTSTTHSYGGGFTMRCNDGIYRNYRMLSKATTGDGNANGNFNSLGALAQSFSSTLVDARVALTPVYGSVMTSQAILCLPGVVGQFSLARVRLRTVRFSNTLLPLFTRFESNGDFIQMSQAIAIVWDKTVLPLTLFP